MKYRGVVISDIHFGVIDSDVLRSELNEIFLKHLSTMKSIDFIIIDGDYFDHKIYLNERVSDYAMAFMDKLVNIAKLNRCPIRCIYGTESHEVNQYNIFSIYKDDKDVDFKVIYTASEEELLPELHVLYLPEEYIYSKKEYYKEFFNKKNYYDYVFGHGVIQEVMTMASKSTSQKESDRKKVPVFTTSELISICKGQVYFGHYHISTNIADKVFYVGSFTRWMHGEEEPKGFFEITCDTEKEKYSQKFIENTLAEKYITYVYGYDAKVMNSEKDLLEELMKRDKLTESNNADHIRYIFNIPENHPNPEFIMNILNERYRHNNQIKVQITNGFIEKKKKINKKKLNDLMEEYPLIFEKSASLEDKIVYFIKKRKGRDVLVDKVKKYLYE